MDVFLRRVIVVDDSDLIGSLQNDELTEGELLEYVEDGSPIAYELHIGCEVGGAFLADVVGFVEGEENAIADSDDEVLLWEPESVEEALEQMKARLEEPDVLARDLIDRANAEFADDAAPCDVSEVVDVLEKLDRGYDPGPGAHPAVATAALLVRHVLAFRVAARNDAAVISM